MISVCVLIFPPKLIYLFIVSSSLGARNSPGVCIFHDVHTHYSVVQKQTTKKLQLKTQCICLSFFLSLSLSFLAGLGLCCHARAFSSCSEWGLLFVVVRGLLIVVASLCCGAQAVGTQASVVVARGLSSCG